MANCHTKGKAPMSEALYKKVCQPAFKRIEDSIDDLKNDFKEFDKKMFKGNGTPSIMATLQGHDDAIVDLKRSQGRITTIFLSCLGAVALIFAGIMINDWLVTRAHNQSARTGIVTSQDK